MNEIIRQIIDFGMADILNESSRRMAKDFCVAAGDPVGEVDADDSLLKGEKLLSGQSQFVVCGNSMSPKGIDDGDNLIGNKFDLQVDEFHEGDFLILKVDPNYYEGETPNYSHKLRCAILRVPKDWTEKRIVEELKTMDSQPEIWLKSYRKCLHDKLEKARKHYSDRDLILSCTFKNGDLRYSFHDINYIEYKVVASIEVDSRTKRSFLNDAA